MTTQIGKTETMTILVGLLIAGAFIAARLLGGALTGLNIAVVVFAMVAAWWGIALGVLSDTTADKQLE